VEERFIADLEEEEVICPVCQDQPREKLFSQTELEKVRIAKIHVEEMGVNLAGVEIILRMRQNMLAMRRQFDAILEDLAREVQETLKQEPS